VNGSTKIPVILDTDIGSDIDDTWSLALLLKSPELDVRLVVTDTSDTRYRARVAAKMLEAGGRADVPVGVGVPIPQDRHPTPQAPWVEGYDLANYPGPVYEDGVGALIDTIMSAAEPVTLICIGPVPNVGRALDREPCIAQRARFVGMHGSVRRGYGGSATIAREWNVVNHTRDCQKVFTAPWDMTITPVDTCGLVQLDGDRYRAVRDCPDPLIRALIETYRIWAKSAKGLDPDVRSSTLFDTVAVYLAFAEDLLVMERLGIRVTDDGYTLVDPAAKPIRCATAWRDLPAFQDLLVHRLTRQ